MFDPEQHVRDPLMVPWRLDPRSTLRPDPQHWENAPRELRAIALGQALQGSYVGPLGRLALRAREYAHSLLSNAQPELRATPGER